MPHEWGGDREEYVGKHRKKGCAVIALVMVGLSGGLGAAIVDWLS